MPLLETAVRRRFVGRLERGEELARTIRETALSNRLREVEVRALGRLEWVEIGGAGPGVTERIEGPLDVVSLLGRVSVADGRATLALVVHAIRMEPGRPAVTGRLARAGADGLDVVLEVWEEIGVASDARGGAPPDVVPRESPRKAAWAKVVQASKRRREPEPFPSLPLPEAPPHPGAAIDLDEPVPEVGDEVLHPKFGRCRVVESADDRLGIRLASGRIVHLGTTVLRFGEPREESGRRVYPVEVLRR